MPEKSEIAKREEATLAFWEKEKIFEKSLTKPDPKGEYVFYDGPPFATGLPHYGHVAGSVIKDVVPRYWTMRGYRVPRVWGWDTHGLPIETIIEKKLGFKHKKDIKAYGVEKFNEQCRAQVLTYVEEWKKFIPRIGRFVDMEHSYTTMDASFMESVWWVFSQVYDKGLVYEDYRSMHICPRCETTLSQQEVSEGYKDVKDIFVTVKFKVKNPEKHELPENTYFLAWTTTPWTLPGNVALAVGEDIEYVVVYRSHRKEEGTVNVFEAENEHYIIAEDQQEKVGTGDAPWHEVKKMKGKELIGTEYEPPFDYYQKDASLKNRTNGWKVYAADFVTTDAGTGIVHIAPAFGEDDMTLGKKERLPFVQHVNMDGTMKKEVTDFALMEVKPKSDDDSVRLATDIAVLKYLQDHGTFFSKEKSTHSYPHCWRCDTPLLNYATTSWFVAVTKIKDTLLETAKDISWSPKHIKDGRFGKWLEGARDWSISRQRFWASAMPIWKAEDGSLTVIGSVAELKTHTKKSGNTYLVMRHGESEANVRGMCSTDPVKQKDTHLTEKGRLEAKTEAEKLKKEEKIDLIIASPFARTTETAKIVAEVLGIPQKEILFDDRLREIAVGIFEGKPVEEYWAFFPSIDDRFSTAPEGAETMLDVRKRVGQALCEFEEQYRGKRILIIAHGDSIWGLNLVSSGMGVGKIEATPVPKTGEAHALDFVPLPHNENYELDLHLPYIDNVKLVNKAGKPLTRVPDVLDTWFDSGSMPYAQMHYPFENKERFEKTFPAQFIAEGLDQTRSWFYYLHVFAGALFQKNAFENVIVNGIVLAEDGKKMSKKLKNYPDPVLVLNKYGADAIRLYILTSPVVEAENLSFLETGVDEVAKKNISRLSNVLSFYLLYRDETPASNTSGNILDRWILGRLNQLLKETTDGYDAYELDRATRPFAFFIDDLSVWYLRRSRNRMKEEGADKTAALGTLRFVLRELSKIMAPATPFLAEELFQAVRVTDDVQSVHLAEWPSVKADTVTYAEGGALFSDMNLVRELSSSALMVRQKQGVKVRQPLARFSAPIIPNIAELTTILKDEINVKEVIEGELGFDWNLTPELIKEGDEREMASAVAQARKKEDLAPSDAAHAEVVPGGKYSATLSTGEVKFNLIRDAT